MDSVVSEWCCRFPKDAKELGKPEKEKLRMTAEAGARFSARATDAAC